MTTPEQIQEWAREADLGGLQLNGEDWAVPLGTQIFAELARTDLVAEIEELRDELFAVRTHGKHEAAKVVLMRAERDKLKAENERLKAACDKYSEDEILMPYQTEVEALRKDAARYRHISEHLPIGTYADYEVSSKETWDIAIDADIEKTK